MNHKSDKQNNQEELTLIGRSTENNFVVNDASLADTHLIITKHQGYQYEVVLAEGVDGDFKVNGIPCTKSLLQNGDTLEVGNSRLEIETEPLLFIFVETAEKERGSKLWIILFILAIFVSVASALYWPRLFPEIAISRYMEQGKLLQKKEEYEKARLSYQNVVKIDRNNVEGNYRLGVVLEKLGKPRRAFDQFMNVVRINPRHIDRYFPSSPYMKLQSTRNCLHNPF
ncbi:MAG: tetratricopeptide repeat protein [Magnetococcales bacterium]|nr:tetratricopeptide repeat protein [Magnetococcales bacterium]